MQTRSDNQFRWFLAGQASWFSAYGVQTVLFPYLVVNVLLQGPEGIGLAQMAIMAPSLVLILIGGVLADSMDLRRLLFTIQLVATLPPIALATALLIYGPSYTALIVYALCYGSLQAFVLPARDALLSRVAGDNMQRAVTSATAIQFASQIVGFVIGGLARFIGAPVLLFAQAGLLAAGAAAATRLDPAPPIKATPINSDDGTEQLRPRLGDIGGAFRQVFDSPSIAPVVLLMMGVGVFFMSVFMVGVPIMVRDLYNGSSGALALVNGAFVIGTITSTVTLMHLPQVQRQGRAIVLALTGGATVIACLSTHPPQLVFYGLVLMFGGGAGVVMSLGRVIVQEAAPATHRARILAVYNLGYLGAAPFGAFVFGQIAAVTGVLTATLWAAMGMGVVLVLVVSTTQVWSISRS